MKPLPSLSHWLRKLGYASYAEYLASEHWQNIRATWKPREVRDGRAACEFCLSSDRTLALHHKTYRRLGRELSTDLFLICNVCHERTHKRFKNGRWSLKGATKYVRKPGNGIVRAPLRQRAVRMDGRSAQAVAIRRRVAAYRKALGAAASEPFVKSRIVELAELEVLTAQLRANALAGQPVDLFELNRMTNATNRLRRSLGLSDRPPEPAPPPLSSYKRKQAEAKP
jgi:hypothetical protein